MITLLPIFEYSANNEGTHVLEGAECITCGSTWVNV